MKWRNFGWLLLLAALWGPSFLFIKVAVHEIPPFTLVWGRVGLAAVVLYGVMRWQGSTLPAWGKVWQHLTVAALFHNAIPFVLFSWGEQYIDSALAAILNGTTPVFTILLAHWFVADDRLTLAKVGGAVLGFAGILVLMLPSLQSGVQATTLGLLAVTVAAACYGVAIVYARMHLRGVPPLVASTAQLLVASVVMAPLSLGLERPWQLGVPSGAAIGALLSLTFFGTVLAYLIYYHLVTTADASYLSMVTYIIPIFGVVLGVSFLGETLNLATYVGGGFIFLGMMSINGLFQLNWWRRKGASVPISGD
ncbi:MAG TPA: EamA family transporter [Anaerolineae bacterium]|nr:EamA family transporter [Anaerolineae bacterium]